MIIKRAMALMILLVIRNCISANMKLQFDACLWNLTVSGCGLISGCLNWNMGLKEERR